jgi:hypothetical protein
LALDEVSSQLHALITLSLQKRPHWIGCWAGLRASLDMWRREKLYSWLESNTSSLDIPPVA